jgi:7-cyano-7-deazaguanine synthase in queuosine biosynthesis
MKIQDYCKAMLAEVTAWKEKLEALKKVADSYGTEQKQKVLQLIGQLEQEVVTAQMRVHKLETELETECPSDWSPMKNELDDLFGTIGSSVDRAWRDLSPGEIGG